MSRWLQFPFFRKIVSKVPSENDLVVRVVQIILENLNTQPSSRNTTTELSSCPLATDHLLENTDGVLHPEEKITLKFGNVRRFRNGEIQ